MRGRDIQRVGCLGAANLYEGRAHFRIQATNLAAFKPYRKRWVNGVDYWPQAAETPVLSLGK
jgi:hypothetical protein